MLRLDGLTVGYGGTTASAVLENLTFEAAAGDFICLLGRNGVGKTTLLRTIAGLQPALSGRVLLDGDDVAALSPTAKAQRVAVVLTERVASPGLRVDDVLDLARQPFTRWQGRLQQEDREIVRSALASVGAEAFAGRFIDDLSDGERQRVMVARAIAQTPRLLLLDEVTAFLDLPARVELMMLLKQLAARQGLCVLLSSHDLELSLELAGRIWLLDGQGSVVTGRSDELVGTGAIGSVFDTGDVRFSPESKRFELARSSA